MNPILYSIVDILNPTLFDFSILSLSRLSHHNIKILIEFNLALSLLTLPFNEKKLCKTNRRNDLTNTCRRKG